MTHKIAADLLSEYCAAEEFYVPADGQGQIVTVSYGFSIPGNVWFARACDAADRTMTVRAYRHHPADSSEEFDYSTAPMLGEEIGIVWQGCMRDDPRDRK